MVICDIHGDSKEATILTLRSDDGVVELLERLEADRAEVEEAEINEHEIEIYHAVFEVYNLTAAQRTRVEDYRKVL